MAAYCFDEAITTCGIVVDNAVAERTKVIVNGKTEYRPKYTIEQVLDEHFYLPRPLPRSKTKAAPAQNNAFALLLSLAGQPGSGVKKWEYVKPS